MASHSRLAIAFFFVWLAIGPSASASMRQSSSRPDSKASLALARLQDQTEVPQSFVSGPWLVTIVDAVQSPAIEGIANTAPIGTEWAVIVADVANFSEETASLSLVDFALGSGAPAADQTEQAVAIADVNLRAGPGTDTAILGAILEGSTVTLLGESQNGFLSVDSAGQQGWIFADFLSVGGSVASGTAPATIDVAASQAAADALDLEASPELTVEPGDTQRTVVAFPVTAGVQQYALVLGSEDLPIVAQQRAVLDPGGLSELTTVPARDEVDLVDVTGSRSLEVREEDGSTTEIQLFGVDSPTGGECFADEAEAELATLVSNSISVESLGDEYLVWASNDAAEAPTLVNYALVEGGFAASEQEDNPALFSRWIAAADERAQEEERGLWGTCTGVHGTEKPQPTPTPVPTPSAAEIRAEYPVLPDVRELAIRPGNMLGDNVAFTGEIFSIQVAAPGNAFFLGESESVVTLAAMQIWVTAPDGTREAIYVGFDGDTAGMFEGTFVTVYGTVEGVQSGTNAFGGSIYQPLVKADIIDFA